MGEKKKEANTGEKMWKNGGKRQNCKESEKKPLRWEERKKTEGKKEEKKKSKNRERRKQGREDKNEPIFYLIFFFNNISSG